MSLLEAAMRTDRVGASWKENAWRMYSKAEPAQPSGIASKKYFGRARRYVTCVTFTNASLCHSSKPQCELIALGQAGRRTHGECTQRRSQRSHPALPVRNILGERGVM